MTHGELSAKKKPKEYITSPHQTTDDEVFTLLRALKGHKLTDGGEIAGFTITFTDKKTGDKTIVEI